MKTKIYFHVEERKKRADGQLPVYLLAKNSSGRFYIATDVTTTGKIVDGSLPPDCPGAKTKTALLRKYLAQAECVCALNNNNDMTNQELKQLIEVELFGEVNRKVQPKTMSYFIREYAATMKNQSTRKLYELTANRVEEYDDGIVPDKVSREWLEGFEDHLYHRGMSINGVAQKMRNIRTVMNWCIDESVTTNYPFRGRKGYKIKEEEVQVNNLTAQEFADLRDYPCEPWQQIYIDMFCLSTYLGGVNVGDLLQCRGLTKGRFVYVRRKTDKVNAQVKRTISIPVCDEAREIIQRYKGKNYLLNIMDTRKDYHTFTQHWNKALKKIGPSEIVPDKVGKKRKIKYKPIFPSITTYTARYTFASVAANDLDISEAKIARCLGHSWAAGKKQVTARYISNDQKKVDEVIYQVVEYLGKFKGRYIRTDSSLV